MRAACNCCKFNIGQVDRTYLQKAIIRCTSHICKSNYTRNICYIYMDSENMMIISITISWDLPTRREYEFQSHIQWKNVTNIQIFLSCLFWFSLIRQVYKFINLRFPCFFYATKQNK